jgi:hypothetical protein
MIPAGPRTVVDVREMNCDELVERVTDYLEDALTPVDQLRLDEHITVCIGCQAHLGEVEVMLDLISSTPAEPLSPGLESSLMAIHRQWAESVGA